MRQTSRGKFNRLQRATAEFTTSALDGYGLRDPLPARPAPYASYPVLVHRLSTPATKTCRRGPRLASLLYACFRPRLAATPLRFATTSPPSGCEEDLHLQAVEHARHTKKRAAELSQRPVPALNEPRELHYAPNCGSWASLASWGAQPVFRHGSAEPMVRGSLRLGWKMVRSGVNT
jgi:hypothetical protein